MPPQVPSPDWADERLVASCMDGSDRAWNALVEKYKNLTWAIILRYGVPRDDAADVFQAVWLDIYNDLGQLRDRTAVKPWLSTVVRNKCFHWQKKSRRRHRIEGADESQESLEEKYSEDPEFDIELERQQFVRQAIEKLGERCRKMVRMLFFSEPPLPYKEVANKLGLAVGSIGFIRGRCLKKLERALESLDLDFDLDLDLERDGDEP